MLDPVELKILTAFDLAGSRALPLNALGDAAVVPEVVARLVQRGWLRTKERDTYERTETGRLQLVSPRDVTIYSRPGCRLCDEAKLLIAPLLKQYGGRLTEVNIDDDSDLRAQYDVDIPVIFLGSRKIAKHRVDVAQFKRQISDASRE